MNANLKVLCSIKGSIRAIVSCANGAVVENVDTSMFIEGV